MNLQFVGSCWSAILDVIALTCVVGRPGSFALAADTLLSDRDLAVLAKAALLLWNSLQPFFVSTCIVEAWLVLLSFFDRIDEANIGRLRAGWRAGLRHRQVLVRFAKLGHDVLCEPETRFCLDACRFVQSQVVKMVEAGLVVSALDWRLNLARAQLPEAAQIVLSGVVNRVSLRLVALSHSHARNEHFINSY